MFFDDCNFMNVEKESLEAILPIGKEVFKEFNLFINTEKTEFTHVFLAPVGETIDYQAECHTPVYHIGIDLIKPCQNPVRTLSE